MFITALYVTAEKWKQPKSPSTGEEINQVGPSIHIMEDYLVTKKKME